ncbi:MAG: hypothetical protein NUK63_00090 [Candidatus Bathyarchaeum tardum]|nr:MAG: hypothetical protein NUK63_00090 [Candidatus Bathyarchaeum tardum]
MNPFDFLEYPEYFPLFMIWASGYVFIYCLFGRSREWKNFDATLKLVLSLITGLAIELCLILPFYYWDVNNLGTALFLPVFEKTWIYHWMLTALVAILFRTIPNKVGFLKVIYLFFSKILLYLFMGWFFVNWILLLEYVYIYPTYVNESTVLGLYFTINFIFSTFGFSFCLLFPNYIQNVYDSELLYGGKGYTEIIRREIPPTERRFRLFLANQKNRFKTISKSKRRFLLPILLFSIVGLIIPLDAQYKLFTPNVEFSTDLDNFGEQRYFMTLELSGRGYNLEPKVEVNFEKIACDSVQINRGIFDQLDVFSIPIPTHCLRNDVVIRHYESIDYRPDVLRIVYPESLAKNISITPVPIDSDPKKLQIQFNTENEKSFNFTMRYLASTDVDNVNIKAENVRGEVYNSTHDRWIQDFQISNLNNFDISLEKLSYDQLIYADVDRESITLEYNGNVIDYVNPINEVYNNLHLYVGKEKTFTFRISFLSTNKFP